MKITLLDLHKKIGFIPEGDKDCFDLGRFSTMVDNSLNIESSTDKPMPKINVFEISTDDLWRFIVAKII